MTGMQVQQMQHALMVMQQLCTDLQADKDNLRQIVDGLSNEISIEGSFRSYPLPKSKRPWAIRT